MWSFLVQVVRVTWRSHQLADSEQTKGRFFDVTGKPFYSLPLATVAAKLKADMASKSN